VDPVSVFLARLHRRQISVPAKSRYFGQIHPGFIAVFVKQAQLNSLGDFRENRKIGACPVIYSTQGKGGSWPDFHCAFLPFCFGAYFAGICKIG
jgi:hypothetical protein